MTHITCRLTAKNRDQLRNLTLGNRVRAIFTCFILRKRGDHATVQYSRCGNVGRNTCICHVQESAHQSFHTQGCFAIDYDFATHRCYFFAVNVLLVFVDDDDDPDTDPVPVPMFLHCIIAAGVPQPSALGLRANPTVVHISLCKYLDQAYCFKHFLCFLKPRNRS